MYLVPFSRLIVVIPIMSRLLADVDTYGGLVNRPAMPCVVLKIEPLIDYSLTVFVKTNTKV